MAWMFGGMSSPFASLQDKLGLSGIGRVTTESPESPDVLVQTDRLDRSHFNETVSVLLLVLLINTQCRLTVFTLPFNK